MACRAVSPETETDFTLISSRFGWRLHRRVDEAGITFEWRCPSCWERFKQQRASGGEPPPSSHGFLRGPPSSGRLPKK